MSTSDFNLKNYLDIRQNASEEFLSNVFEPENELLSEDLLENINSTPLGRLLEIIGSLPEIRQDKVFNIRKQINHGQYNLGHNLDSALDKVLEEFISKKEQFS